MKKNITNLNNTEYKQYAQQIILENIGINGQKRLKNTKILIIGLGGLGCPALLYLAASGIGNIGIMDHDQINISNLNRQILYNFKNIQQNKTNCAKIFIKNINQECKITIYNYNFNRINGNKIIKKYDIIIDATDNFKARYTIDKICYKLHKIHIYGAINKYDGHISIFNYKNNLRYIDIYPKNLDLQELSCENNGIIGTMSGIIGILQATETIKIITGIGNIKNGYMLKYNLLESSFHYVKCHPIKQKNKNDIIQNSINEIHNILEIQDINKENIKDCIIIDIRNIIDFHRYHSYKSINIPKQYFQAKQTIDLIKFWSTTYTIIISCNQVITSFTISNLLKKFEIKTYILKTSS
uniref:Molybdopterin biosynthesis protein n=1 Tax=Ceramothamnion japonicum TaxID=218448 RepID=A0A1C9CDF4_CERJP|nr:molybdopterin biosynthesis protein [Ceramium japonicum]AOM66431.1 molybdopterin biosynthesis protein [Ceramium japonicum]